MQTKKEPVICEAIRESIKELENKRKNRSDEFTYDDAERLALYRIELKNKEMI